MPLPARCLAFISIATFFGCSDGANDAPLEDTSTGTVDEATTGDPSSSDDTPMPDVYDPFGKLESGPIDPNGCFGWCLSDEMPTNNQIADPYCIVEVQAQQQSPVEIPACDGSTPDDYAVPEGADVCYWFAVDTELWQLTPDDPRDDVAEECKPTNVSFKFVERVEGTLESLSVYATCATDRNGSALCCNEQDNC